MLKFARIFLIVLVALFVIAQVQSAQAQTAWAPNTAYSVGQLVTYGGATYKCIQAHTSQVGWEPPNVPALWQDMGASGGSTPVPPTKTNTPTGPTPVPPANGSPFGGTAASVPGTVQAENFNTGGEGVDYHDNEAA